jgi:hypothetical protein
MVPIQIHEKLSKLKYLHESQTKFSKKESRMKLPSNNKKNKWGGGAHINTHQNQEFIPCALLLLKKKSLRSPHYSIILPSLCASPTPVRQRLTTKGEKRERSSSRRPFHFLVLCCAALLASVVSHCVRRNSVVSSSFWSENPVDEHVVNERWKTVETILHVSFF